MFKTIFWESNNPPRYFWFPPLNQLQWLCHCYIVLFELPFLLRFLLGLSATTMTDRKHNSCLLIQCRSFIREHLRGNSISLPFGFFFGTSSGKVAFSGVGVELVSMSPVVCKADMKVLLYIISFTYKKNVICKCIIKQSLVPFHLKQC